MSFTSDHKKGLLWLLAQIILILSVVTFSNREDFFTLFIPFTLLFALYFWSIKNTQKFTIRHVFIAGLISRLLFLFYIPEWSDDFYRFLWDGHLMHHGINPYLMIPKEMEDMASYYPQLYQQMNSLSYYSVYPPVSQLIYFLGAFSKSLLGGVVIMRLLIIAAEVALFFVVKRLLVLLSISVKRVVWYFLNPLVIIELSGNLHLEGIMLLLLLSAVLMWIKEKNILSAFFFALSVATKLIPLMFLPLFIKSMGFKKNLFYGAMVLFFLALLFLPFYDSQIFVNMGKSVNLYFQTFEFNASIYYLFREIGFYFKGYNTISFMGPALSLVVILFVVFASFKVKKQSALSWFHWGLLSLTVYYLLSTTVHPWYIILPFGLGIFTHFNYPLAWSYLIGISYFAYQGGEVQEHLWILAVEYVLLFLVIAAELFVQKRKIGQG